MWQFWKVPTRVQMSSIHPLGGLQVSNMIYINTCDFSFAPLHGSFDSFLDMVSSITTL